MARDDNSSLDEFWDIEKLLPQRKTRMSPFSSGSVVTDVEITAAEEDATCNDGDRKITAFSLSNGTRPVEESYFPEEAGMIKRVTVKRFVDKYDFYDNFRKAALIYWDYKTPRCDFAQFYSYMPQYSQLNGAQKNYYFYWRSEMLRGKYIKTDYSYIYLYAYEVLNLPDKIPPNEGLLRLITLWRAYRKDLPRLDLYFSVWVQDYCLVHRLPCPVDKLGDFIFDIISSVQFKEFYLSQIDLAGADGAMAALAYLSDYDWRKGRYSAGNPSLADNDPRRCFATAEAYREHLRGAAYALLSVVWKECAAPNAESPTKILTRNAFPNSLCTHTVKCMLEIEYYPISEAEGLRAGITAAVRYIENRLRALMGVKSRLAVKGLPDEYRAIIDRYFDSVYEVKKREIDRASVPEYEKLYDAPDEQLSSYGADEIERVSWGTTLRLVEDTEDYSESLPSESADNSEATVIADPSAIDADYGLSSVHVELLSYLAGISSVDTNVDISCNDTIAEEINEAFVDNFGDIVLEYDGEKYVIIDDYLEDVIEWLKKIRT